MHPAVAAWHAVSGANGAPTEIHALKPDRPSKCAVFRLIYDRGGTQIIAKRYNLDGSRLERSLYERVLPGLPLRTLKCFGALDDHLSNLSWLFIEDAGDLRYSPASATHRALSAKWLAQLHLSTASLGEEQRRELRAAGAERYRPTLERSISVLLKVRGEPVLAAAAPVLQELMSRLSVVEAQWDVLSPGLPVPEALVHGDFTRKNLRVLEEATGGSVTAFDWEMAGWGVPAADLAGLRDDQLRAYHDIIVREGCHVEYSVLERAAQMGRLYRLVAAIGWELEGLGYSRPDRAIERMAVYKAGLDDWLTRTRAKARLVV